MHITYPAVKHNTSCVCFTAYLNKLCNHITARTATANMFSDLFSSERIGFDLIRVQIDRDNRTQDVLSWSGHNCRQPSIVRFKFCWQNAKTYELLLAKFHRKFELFIWPPWYDPDSGPCNEHRSWPPQHVLSVLFQNFIFILYVSAPYRSRNFETIFFKLGKTFQKLKRDSMGTKMAPSYVNFSGVGGFSQLSKCETSSVVLFYWRHLQLWIESLQSILDKLNSLSFYNFDGIFQIKLLNFWGLMFLLKKALW